MPKFWDYLGRNSPKHRNLQDGLFQIASQTCNLLVQVNNTNNISFGDNATNILSNNLESARFKSYTSAREESEQLVVLLPPSKPIVRGARSKSFGGILKPKLSTVLESSPLPNDEEGDLWNHGFVLPINQDGSPVRRIGNRKNWCRPSCIPISIILLLIFLVVLLPLLDHSSDKSLQLSNSLSDGSCQQECSLLLVETVPEGLEYKADVRYRSTFSTWIDFINNAKESIEIASTYWDLRQAELYPDPSSAQGEDIFSGLLEAAIQRGVAIRIIQSVPSKEHPNIDTDYLKRKKAADIRNLNLVQLLGRGNQNAKLWIVDGMHFYIGSAGMDWRALTQTKELGVAGYNCSCLAEDIQRIFQTYWSISEKNSTIPEKWSPVLSTKFNMTSTINVTLESHLYQIFITSSPMELLANGRSNILTSILSIIKNVEKYVYISLNYYIPLLLNSPTTKYWSIIDDMIRTVAIDSSVQIKMLISSSNQSWQSQDYFLKSLADIAHFDRKISIEIRRFVISGTEDHLKFSNARISNCNYMVTETTAYVGSSGWSGDSFLDSSGVGFVLHDESARDDGTSFRNELETIFERDWDSQYAFPLAIDDR